MQLVIIHGLVIHGVDKTGTIKFDRKIRIALYNNWEVKYSEASQVGEDGHQAPAAASSPPHYDASQRGS